MGFLRRLLGGGNPGGPPAGAVAWPPRGPITSWPSGDVFEGFMKVHRFDPPAHRGVVEVVGESACQGTLRLIAGGFGIDGPMVRDDSAILVPEPGNPYDANAVRVISVPAGPDQVWGKVGYLSREDAVAFRPVIDRLATQGYVTGCRASLKGGQVREDGGRNYVGVALYLDQPAALMAELDADPPMPSWE